MRRPRSAAAIEQQSEGRHVGGGIASGKPAQCFVVPIEDARPLVVVGPDSRDWAAVPLAWQTWAKAWAVTGAIVWLEPPAGTDASAIVGILREKGVAMKLVRTAADPAAVPAAIAAAPAPARSELRAVVLELARAAEADYPGVTAVCEQALAEGGL